MDAYPGDLAGALPLVFAVNAVLLPKTSLASIDENKPPPAAAAVAEGNEFGESTTSSSPQKEGNQSAGSDTTETQAQDLVDEEVELVPSRIPFDKFLRAIKGHHGPPNEDVEEYDGGSVDEYTTNWLNNENAPENVFVDPTDLSSSDVSSSPDSPAMPPHHQFGLFNRTTLSQRFRFHTAASSKSTTNNNATPSNKKGIHQSFFHRARVVPVSKRHVFPPSKDANGTANRTIFHARTIISTPAPPIPTLTKQNLAASINAVRGLLPTGWIEKHCHALPSVVIIVTSIDLSLPKKVQKKQDEQLLNVMDMLRSSLAPKRECCIHLACIIIRPGNKWSGDSDVKENERLANIRNVCKLSPSAVSVLHDEDLVPPEVPPPETTSSSTSGGGGGGPPTFDSLENITPALRRLHRSVRDASNAYYLGQARRAKRKHSTLQVEKYPQLLPLSARYLFKIGILYEFQGKLDRAHGYFSEAYDSVVKYYGLLREVWGRKKGGLLSGSSISRAESVENMTTAVEKGNEGGSEEQEKTGGDGVEVTLEASTPGALLDSPSSPSKTTTPVLQQNSLTSSSTETPPENSNNTTSANNNLANVQEFAQDMSQQCLGVADWLNFKLVYYSLISSPDLLHPNPAFLHHSHGNTSGAAAAASSRDLSMDSNEGNNGTGGGSGNNETGGPVAVVNQWRRHCISFLSRRHSSSQEEPKALLPPLWWYWAYVARQRLVLSRLTERYPQKPDCLGGRTGPFGDVLLSCCAWRYYVSAAEAVLNLMVELKKEEKESVDKEKEESSKEEGGDVVNVDGASSRKRFVGDLDAHYGYELSLKEELKRDHAAHALEYITRAISLYEEECSPQTTTEEEEDTKNTTFVAPEQERSGTRMYYIAGGIFLKMGRKTEAAAHFEKALSRATRWPGLKVNIRRALVSCLQGENEQQSPEGKATEEEEKSNAADVALMMVLDRKDNALVSTTELQRMLDRVFQLNARNLDWPAGSASSAPFSFAVSFPETTHATTGDTVQALGSFKSHLRIPVLIGGIDILTNVGTVKVSLQSLVSGPNKDSYQVVDDGSSENKSEDGILLKPDMEIFFTLEIDLPTDASKITPLSGDHASSTKHAVKNVKPVSAGFTTSGGACYTLRPSILKAAMKSPATIKGEGKEGSAFLNGSSVACEGIVLDIHPPSHGIKGKGVNIKLRSERRGLGPLLPPTKGAVAKRTHFEEDNYVSSAWARPQYHPLSLGPRCLRVLGAMPQLEIKDLTTSKTNGKLMEGTVNRILLSLRAGEHEQCHGLRVSMKCTSTVIDSTNVATSPKRSKQSSGDDGAGTNANIPRMPMLVVKSGDESDVFTTEDGIQLPPGWKPKGNKDGTGSKDEFELITSDMDSGCAAFVHLDLFRPLPVRPINGSPSAGELPVSTNFEISVAYNQIRPRRRRSKVTESVDDSERVSDSGDPVTQHFRGSVAWCSPIGATFSIVEGTQKSYPSGSSHPSNLVSTKTDSTSETAPEAAAINGEKIQIRCSLQADEAANNLAAEISSVSFEAPDQDEEGCETKCDLSLVSGSEAETNSGLLYASKQSDISRLLNSGATFGLSYSVQAKIRSTTGSEITSNEPQHLSTALGVLSVEWLPISLTIAKNEVEDMLKGKTGIDYQGQILPDDLEHGPLRLSKPCKVIFSGPTCHIENAPFNAVLTAFPPSPRVAIPFEVKYCVTNKTPLHQKLAVSMSEASPGDRSPDGSSDGVLLSGLVHGEIHLAPFEARTLSYSALAIRAGKTPMPALTVSSSRHKSWVINDGPTNPRHFFVLP